MHNLRLLVIVLVIVLPGGCRSNSQVGTGMAGGEFEKTALPGATIWVKGMSCPQCANNITHQIGALPGVRTVKVDLGDGRVLVQFAGAEKPTAAQLETAIRESGFTPTRVEFQD